MRHVLTILALQIIASMGGLQRGAEPPAIPTKFLMTTSGLMGSGQSVLLQDGVLVYTEHTLNGSAQRKTITATPDRWRQFRQALDAINVWSWRADYPNPSVADGLRWEIDVVYPDRKLHASGKNNYPDDNGRPANSAEQTKAFQRLREAVQALLGDSSF